MRAVVAQLAQVLLRVLPERLERVAAVRRLHEQVGDVLDAGGDFVRRLHNHVVRFLLAQIGEFLQHLVGGAEVERRLMVAVLKALGVHQYGAVNGVLRLFEVHVSGRHNRLAQLFAQPDDIAVDVLQRFLVLHDALAHHEFVVAQRLNF